MMSRDEAREMFGKYCELAKENILRDGELISAFIIHAHNGQVTLISAPWKDDSERSEVIKCLRIMCIAHDAAAVCWINEAWMLTYGMDEKITVRPKDSERRQEVVVVHMACQQRDMPLRHMMSSREIIRNDEGKVVSLGEEKYGDDANHSSGVLLDILPPVRVPSGARKLAMELVRQARRSN